jgi:MFS family permease
MLTSLPPRPAPTTSTPPPQTPPSQVIQVHIISMFLPSLCTGHVISLLGALWTMSLGSALLLGGTAVFFAGSRLPVFFAGNAVVGLGWNWAYVGASALVAALTAAHPESRLLAQGCMDSLVLLGTGLSVVLAGTLYSGLGWVTYTAVFIGVSGLMVGLDMAHVLVHARRAGCSLLCWVASAK